MKGRNGMIGLKTVNTTVTNEIILKLNSALEQFQGDTATEIAKELVKDYINFRKVSDDWSSKINIFPRTSVEHKNFENKRAYNKKFKIFRHIMIDLETEKFFFHSTFDIKEILDKENIILLSHFSKEDKIKLESLLTQLLGTNHQAVWFKYNLKKKQVLKEVSEFVTEVVTETVKEFILEFSANTENVKCCIQHHLLGENNQIGRKELVKYFFELTNKPHPTFHFDYVFGNVDKLIDGMKKDNFIREVRFDNILENSFWSKQLRKIQDEKPIDFESLDDSEKENICGAVLNIFYDFDEEFQYSALYILNLIVGYNKKYNTILLDVFTYLIETLKTKGNFKIINNQRIEYVLDLVNFKYLNKIANSSEFIIDENSKWEFAGEMDLDVSIACQKILPTQPVDTYSISTTLSEIDWLTPTFSYNKYFVDLFFRIVQSGRPQLNQFNLHFDKTSNFTTQLTIDLINELCDSIFTNNNVIHTLTFAFDKTIYSDEEIKNIQKEIWNKTYLTKDNKIIFEKPRK